MTVLFRYVLLVPTKKSALKSKDFYFFVCTPCVSKKGYTYDAFLTSTIKVMLEPLKTFLSNFFQNKIKIGLVLGNSHTFHSSCMIFVFLQLLPMAAGNSLLHIRKIEFFCIFYKNRPVWMWGFQKYFFFVCKNHRCRRRRLMWFLKRMNF